MEKKEGKYLCNARVDIDYTGKKPKIDFAYPGKDPAKDQIKQGGHPVISIALMILIVLVPALVAFGYYSFDIPTYSYPSECGNISYDKLSYNKVTSYTGDYNLSFNNSYSTIYGFNITCDNITHEINYNILAENRFDKPYFSSFNERGAYQQAGFVFGIIVWMVLGLRVSSYINRKITKRLVKNPEYQKWLPKRNAERGIIFKKKKKNYKKFLPEDMLGNTLIIPRFNNVELDYETTGDFNKYLTHIKIREYRTQSININTKKLGKEKVDDFKWYAVFSFKEKPKTGFMEVIYQ